MSVFHVAEWTAARERLPELERALDRALEHVRGEHPSVRGARCWRVSYGPGPARPGFVWMEEFESLTACEEAQRLETTGACEEVWAAIHACTMPGTFSTSLWNDQDRPAWFDR